VVCQKVRYTERVYCTFFIWRHHGQRHNRNYLTGCNTGAYDNFQVSLMGKLLCDDIFR